MRDRSENQITLVLIRHGATKSNKERRYLGKTEEELSREGKKELADYQERQCYPEIDRLFTSPMKRCLQTAEILYPGLQPEQIGEWTEMDFGAFEGKNYRELQGDERYQEWLDSNGTLPFPGGESREEFTARCGRGFLRMLESVQENEEQNVIGTIVHGGTIMALLSKYSGGDYFHYQVPNGKGYICMVKKTDKGLEISELKKI